MFACGSISDLTPLAGLTGLKELYLASNKIPDVSPLSGIDYIKSSESCA